MLYGLYAFLLEAGGVASGIYTYGDFLIKILGVPLFIPIMWVAIAFLACLMYRRYGWKGIFIAYGFDLILEPLAYYTGLWTWLNTYTPQIYFGSTVLNVLVWIGMCLLGAKLYS